MSRGQCGVRTGKSEDSRRYCIVPTWICSIGFFPRRRCVRQDHVGRGGWDM